MLKTASLNTVEIADGVSVVLLTTLLSINPVMIPLDIHIYDSNERNFISRKHPQVHHKESSVIPEKRALSVPISARKTNYFVYDYFY